MIVDGKEVKEIIVKNKNDVLIASITDQDIISDNGYLVSLDYCQNSHQDSQQV